MPTNTEEQQAKDFLQRAEIRTMRKDLKALREGDALKERDKISKIETPEEQDSKQKQITTSAPVIPEAKPQAPIGAPLKSANEQRATENALKVYANEQEKQQIFSLEAERIRITDQLSQSSKTQPSLQTEKSKLLSLNENLKTRLAQIIESQKKLEGEQKFVTQEAEKASDDSQKKAFLQAGSDFDEKAKTQEKQRWTLEKEISENERKIQEIDNSSSQSLSETNNLRTKIIAIDKSLQDVYSGIITRVEKEKEEKAKNQMSEQDIINRAKKTEQEKIQKEHQTIKELNLFKNKEVLSKIPSPYRANLDKGALDEEEARKKFMQAVEEGAKKDNNQNIKTNNN